MAERLQNSKNAYKIVRTLTNIVWRLPVSKGFESGGRIFPHPDFSDELDFAAESSSRLTE